MGGFTYEYIDKTLKKIFSETGPFKKFKLVWEHSLVGLIQVYSNRFPGGRVGP